MKHLFAASLVGAVCIFFPTVAGAQGGPQAASPATVLDLTKPQFDTATPHYEVEGAAERAASTVVADVGGRGVTLGMVGDAVRDLPPIVRSMSFETIYPPIVAQLIQTQALVVRAQRRGLDKDPAVKRRAQVAFDTVLANAILVREAGGGITEQMMLDRYNRDYAGKPGPEELQVFVIMLSTEAEATSIIAELAGGADFATIARRVSRDSSAAQGGDLGFVRQGGLTLELGSVAFSMASGRTAARPVRTQAGWFIVRVGERRIARTLPFNEVREEIKGSLMREAFPGIAQAAVNDIKIHNFDITGREVEIVTQTGQ